MTTFDFNQSSNEIPATEAERILQKKFFAQSEHKKETEVQISNPHCIPLFTILQSLQMVLIMVLYELFCCRSFLSRNRRWNRDIRTWIETAVIRLQVQRPQPHRPIITIHFMEWYWIVSQKLIIELIENNSMQGAGCLRKWNLLWKEMTKWQIYIYTGLKYLIIVIIIVTTKKFGLGMECDQRHHHQVLFSSHSNQLESVKHLLLFIYFNYSFPALTEREGENKISITPGQPRSCLFGDSKMSAENIDRNTDYSDCRAATRAPCWLFAWLWLAGVGYVVLVRVGSCDFNGWMMRVSWWCVLGQISF